MAAVEVTINGIIWDKALKAGRPVTIIGEAFISGLGVGGGPIIPPEGGGGQPPGIWGPTDPRPTPPIANVPGAPGYRPPSAGGPVDPGWGVPERPADPGYFPPHPAHPIAPGGPPPDQPPPDTSEPPIEWKAVWHPVEGWIVVGVPNVPHPAPGE